MFHHIIQCRAAFGDLVGRQVLDPDMARRNSAATQGDDGANNGVAAGACLSWVVERGT